MTTSRRDFIKHAALLSGSLGSFSALPPSLARALSIDPDPGSTFMDAQHVVILMQENRSFDHMYATFRGARGFDDPRSITLPDGNPVFLQSEKGQTYKPFNLDIHGSKATWMGALPHGRNDQLQAGNNGKHDQWIQAKMRKDFPSFTMGYYEEKDIPFYHAFADAFTLCDQHYCAIASSTTPNRSYLWSGTIRYNDKPEIAPCVTNSMLDRHHPQDWTTFPERLSEAGVSWRIYQNEITEPTGLEGANKNWLGNFGNNPLEWFSQYRVGSHAARREFLHEQRSTLKKEIEQLNAEIAQIEQKAIPQEAQNYDQATANKKKAVRELSRKRIEKAESLKRLEQDLLDNPPIDDASIPEVNRDLHIRAFTTNSGNTEYRKLSSIRYDRSGTQENIEVPASDPFYQLRKDVNEGKLPTVSWLVASREFSDHPSSAWYGAWYVAEALNILTSNPEVWKNTIFILNYDENDGYFDHIPPYNPPRPDDLSTGKTSPDIDTTLEFEHNKAPLGLGYRVPLIVASPWSRGGRICSELFDTTSVIRFLELFLKDKAKKPIRETNITSWRRHIIGDLTNLFQTDPTLADRFPTPPDRDEFVTAIHQSQFESAPVNPPLSTTEIEEVRKNPRASSHIPPQRKGTRISPALPYELYADAKLDPERKSLRLELAAAKDRFGDSSLGSPFQVYAPKEFRESEEYERMRRWSFALSAGNRLYYTWPVASFRDGLYALDLHGPNGFYRSFHGSAADPELEVQLRYGDGDTIILVLNCSSSKNGTTVNLVDAAYGRASSRHELSQGQNLEVPIDLTSSGRWYDFRITVEGSPEYHRHYAGRMENGKDSITDPQIGNRA